MIKNIRNIFNHRQPQSIQKQRKASVMVLLYEENEELYVVFEVRSNKLKNQPGDVCLAGGKVEQDESPKEAALRETVEELNVEIDDIEFIGDMDYFISPYGLIMYAFVGKLKKYVVNPNKNEVDHVFKVPLKFFIENEPELYEMEIGPTNLEGFPFDLIKGGKNYRFRRGILKEYFYKYNDYVIWGFTAHIIKSFVDILKEKYEL